jgi:hypothetical protein
MLIRYIFLYSTIEAPANVAKMRRRIGATDVAARRRIAA